MEKNIQKLGNFLVFFVKTTYLGVIAAPRKDIIGPLPTKSFLGDFFNPKLMIKKIKCV